MIEEENTEVPVEVSKMDMEETRDVSMPDAKSPSGPSPSGVENGAAEEDKSTNMETDAKV